MSDTVPEFDPAVYLKNIANFSPSPEALARVERCRQEVAELGSMFLHLRDGFGVHPDRVHATLWNGSPRIYSAWTYCHGFGFCSPVTSPKFPTEESRHAEVMRIQRLPINCPRCLQELRRIAEGERSPDPETMFRKLPTLIEDILTDEQAGHFARVRESAFAELERSGA